jgi:DNA-binding transcriptional MerR regulator
MQLRVSELAAEAGVSIDTVRYYQQRGLLPPPRREGRVAFYGHEHLTRIQRVKTLQAEGLSLTAIGRLLRGELAEVDEPLVTAVARAGRTGALTLDEVATRSGIPLGILKAAERDGLLVAVGGGYQESDVDAARAALRLLEVGLPLPELFALARRHHEEVRQIAETAVALFDEHVRQPHLAEGEDDPTAARALVEAFATALPATLKIVSHHFERTLLAVALEHIDNVGGEAELEAIREVSA